MNPIAFRARPACSSPLPGQRRALPGLAGQAALFDVWASNVTGTWTILKTAPNGFACIVAVGEGWQDEPLVFTPATVRH